MNGSVTASMFAGQVVHAVIGGAIGWAIIRILRRIRSLSGPVGAMVAAGILMRIGVGLSLFWISYLNARRLSSLHLGDGFWAQMVDARGYYLDALMAVERGFDTIKTGRPSPFYVKTLAIWIHLVGTSPAVGLFLNLCLYVAVVAILVRAYSPANEWRRDLPLLLGAGAFSFSPLMLINGTQTLKDDLFTALVVVACVGALLVLRSLVSSAVRTRRRLQLGAGAVVLTVSTYCISGIRDYFVVIVWAVLALVMALFAIRQPRKRLLEYGLGTVGVLLAVWVAYACGAGPYYRGPTLRQIAGIVSEPPRSAPELGAELSRLKEPLVVVERARAGFATSGGGTNVAAAPIGKASASGVRAVGRRAVDLAAGLCNVFVPMSLLKLLHVVHFSGGRALLPIADLDTLFLDVSLSAVIGLIFARRRVIGDRLPFVVFSIGVSTATALLLGYVVSNYGTLFRMRLMIAVPIWTAVLALAESPCLASSRQNVNGRDDAKASPCAV